MIVALWIAVGVLAVGLAFTAFALAGAIRRVDELRLQVEVPGPVTGEDPGLPVGTRVPPFEVERLDGGRLRTADLTGRKHLVAFADPSCASCDELMPALLAWRGRPPIVVVAGHGEAWPPAWGPLDDEVVRVRDEDGALTAAFDVGFTPHVFVLDETTTVTAQAPAASLQEVRDLVREADGVRIVEGGGA